MYSLIHQGSCRNKAEVKYIVVQLLTIIIANYYDKVVIKL